MKFLFLTFSVFSLCWVGSSIAFAQRYADVQALECDNLPGPDIWSGSALDANIARLRARNDAIICEAAADGWRPFHHLDLDNIEYKPIRFLINHPLANTMTARAFLNALESEKQNLMKLYNLHNYRYNEMAVLAFGIMGNESEFGRGFKYHLKEISPWGVRALKKIKARREKQKELLEQFPDDRQSRIENWKDPEISKNSRGPTQIKDIPPLITEEYGVVPSNLHDPFNAAVATIGYLAETAQWIREQKHSLNLECVTDENFYDMVLWPYFGRWEDVLDCTADTSRDDGYIPANRHFRTLIVVIEKTR